MVEGLRLLLLFVWMTARTVVSWAENLGLSRTRNCTQVISPSLLSEVVLLLLNMTAMILNVCNVWLISLLVDLIFLIAQGWIFAPINSFNSLVFFVSFEHLCCHLRDQVLQLIDLTLFLWLGFFFARNICDFTNLLFQLAYKTVFCFNICLKRIEFALSLCIDIS